MKFEDFKAGVMLYLQYNSWPLTEDIRSFLASMGLDIERATCLQWLKELQEDGQIHYRTIKGNYEWNLHPAPITDSMVQQNP